MIQPQARLGPPPQGHACRHGRARRREYSGQKNIMSNPSIQAVFETSLVVLRDRQERFASNKAVPKNILNCGIVLIDSIISALEKHNSQPFTLEKCFLADLAVKMTRAWEAYSFDESGQTTCMLMYFELSIMNNLLIRKCNISCWFSKSQRICESRKDHSLHQNNACFVS